MIRQRCEIAFKAFKKQKVSKVRAEWSQLRYLLAVPLLALNDPDPHN
jgi:hypothetical protein